MMKATDTVLLGEILEGPVCNVVTTTGGYQSVPVEKPKIKDVTFQLLVKSSDNKQWMETVEEELTLNGFNLYLDATQKKKTDTHTSARLVVKLLNSLEGSNYCYIPQHKDKPSFVDVWKLVKFELTNKTAIYSEIMQFWKLLFLNSAQSRDEFMRYYNVFKTNVQKLNKHKSEAVTDDIFLLSLTFSQLDIPDDKKIWFKSCSVRALPMKT